MAEVGDVSGIKETLATLREMEDKLAKHAQTRSAHAGAATARELMAVAPGAPLSGMAGHGAAKAEVQAGGRRKRGGIPLARVRLTATGWTIASDMARKSSPGATMVRNLTNKYGKASRWVWPTVEQRMKSIEAAVKNAVEDLEKEMNPDLKKKGA